MTASIALLQGAADGARLQLHVSPGFAWIAAGVLFLAVSLSARAWLRSHRRGSILALEAVRLVLVTAVLFVLAQPEWVVTETPDEAPLVTVLWDDSGSMETRDIEGSDGLVARADVVRARIAEIEAHSATIAVRSTRRAGRRSCSRWHVARATITIERAAASGMSG